MATRTRMTNEEHKEIFQAISESVVADPEVPPDPSPEDAPSPQKDVDWRALRGALYLDEHHPGWADKIALDLFDINNIDHCVVGQLAGTYETHAKDLFPVGDGYNSRAEDFGIMPHGNSDVLNKSWKILIKERQKGGK